MRPAEPSTIRTTRALRWHAWPPRWPQVAPLDLEQRDSKGQPSALFKQQRELYGQPAALVKHREFKGRLYGQPAALARKWRSQQKARRVS